MMKLMYGRRPVKDDTIIVELSKGQTNIFLRLKDGSEEILENIYEDNK